MHSVQICTKSQITLFWHTDGKFEPKYLEVVYHELLKIKDEILNIINYSKPVVIWESEKLEYDNLNICHICNVLWCHTCN